MNFGDKIQIGLLTFASIVIVILLLRNSKNLDQSKANINDNQRLVDSLLYQIQKNQKYNDSLFIEVHKLDNSINGIYQGITKIHEERKIVVDKYSKYRSRLSQIEDDSLKKIALQK